MKNFAIVVFIGISFGACDYKNASNGNIDEAFPTLPPLDQGYYENTELKSEKMEMGTHEEEKKNEKVAEPASVEPEQNHGH